MVVAHGLSDHHQHHLPCHLLSCGEVKISRPLGLGLLQFRAPLKLITGNYFNPAVIGVITESNRAIESFDNIQAAHATKKCELSFHVINYHAGASKAPERGEATRKFRASASTHRL